MGVTNPICPTKIHLIVEDRLLFKVPMVSLKSLLSAPKSGAQGLRTLKLCDAGISAVYILQFALCTSVRYFMIRIPNTFMVLELKNLHLSSSRG